MIAQSRGASVIAQARAELLKLRSTRTTVGLLLGMVALTLLIVVLTALLTHPDGLSSKRDQLNLFGNGGIALIFSGFAGVLLITSEYRYATIRPRFLFTPLTCSRPPQAVRSWSAGPHCWPSWASR